MTDFENITRHHVFKYLRTVCFIDISDRKAFENSNASTILRAFFGSFVRTHMKPTLFLKRTIVVYSEICLHDLLRTHGRLLFWTNIHRTLERWAWNACDVWPATYFSNHVWHAPWELGWSDCATSEWYPSERGTEICRAPKMRFQAWSCASILKLRRLPLLWKKAYAELGQQIMIGLRIAWIHNVNARHSTFF